MAEEKCPHEGCDYVDNHRPYARKRDGIPSVTEISSMLDLGKSRSFPWSAATAAATEAVHHSDRWFRFSTRQRDGEECTHKPTGFCTACRYLRSTFDREWKHKRDLGTHVHHLALQWAKGEDVEEDEESKPYLDGLEKFYEEMQPEWLHLESTVAGSLAAGERELFWRGSFDAVCRMTAVGTALIDIKTGGLYPTEQTIQLAGYVMAENLTEWDDGKEIIVGPMPAVDAAGCLFLTGDGDYRLVWLPVNSEAMFAFFELLKLRQFTKHMDGWYKAYKELEAALESMPMEAFDA